jgi:prefoldin subunit 5
MITIEQLQKRKAELQAEQTRLLSSVNALQGAIQLIDELVSAEKATDGIKVTPPEA